MEAQEQPTVTAPDVSAAELGRDATREASVMQVHIDS